MIEPYSKKKHIYQAGAKLFQEKGYAATSMRELAVQVQLEVSSLYSHISSKEQILQSVCFEVAKQFADGIEVIYGDTHSAKQKLKEIIELHLKIITENQTNFNVFNKEYIHMSEPKLSEFLKLRKEYEKKCISILKEGIKLGHFKNLDPLFMMKTLFNSMTWVHEYYKPNKGIDLNLINKSMYKLLISGIRKKN